MELGANLPDSVGSSGPDPMGSGPAQEQEQSGAVGQGRLLSDACPAPQMYGSQDGSVNEHALSSILKTALGVAELTVTDLFRAIDQERKGRIAFGEWPGAGEDTPVRGGAPHSPAPPRDRAGLGRGSLSPPRAVNGHVPRLAMKQMPSPASAGRRSEGPWGQEGFRPDA